MICCWGAEWVRPATRGDLGGVGDTDYRRPIKARAVNVQRRSVHGRIACEAGPCGVPAAMAKASLVSHEHLAGVEAVAVGAVILE